MCLLVCLRYLHNHLTNLFAGAWEIRDLSPLPVHIPQATDQTVRLTCMKNVDCNKHNADIMCTDSLFFSLNILFLLFSGPDVCRAAEQS